MGLSADASFAVPGGDMLMPGDHIEVRVSNLQARDTPGRSQSYWRMIAPAQSDAPDAFEERFGHQLWIDVEVVADGTQSGSAGSASLSGSSMFAPPHAPESVASPRSERTSASIAGQYHSAATQASLDTIIRSSLPPTIANTNVTTDEEWHSSTGLNSPASDAQSEEEDDPFESAEVVSDAESYEVIDETSSDEAD